MQSSSSTSFENEKSSFKILIKRLISRSRHVMISIMFVCVLAACTPVCDVLPDTSFVANVLDVDLTTEETNTQKIIVRYKQYRLSVNLDSQVPLIDGMGNALKITDLSKGQELSILGILTEPNVVQAQEIRLIRQLTSN